jgi:AcrR family transcriptional regulator
MPATTRRTASRERLLEAATELFFKQGYQATSVDQIIELSGLTKPTLYKHFPNKEALCVAYVEGQRREVIREQRALIAAETTPEGQFLATIKFVRSGMLAHDYRGCAFFNIVSEIPDPENPVVIAAKEFVRRFRDEIYETAVNLKESDPKYAAIDVSRVTDSYYLILNGAIVVSQELREPWPLDRAVEDLEGLLARLAD